MVKILNTHKQSVKDALRKLYSEKACSTNIVNMWPKSLKMSVFLFIDISFSNNFQNCYIVAIFWVALKSWFSSSIYLLFENKSFLFAVFTWVIYVLLSNKTSAEPSVQNIP